MRPSEQLPGTTAHVPGQAAAALIVRLAQTALDLDRQLTDLDHEVAGISEPR